MEIAEVSVEKVLWRLERAVLDKSGDGINALYFVSYNVKIPVPVLVPGGIDYIPVPSGI